MTRLYKYFFRGLITVLPLALTIYLLYIFLAWTEAVALTFLRPFIGGFYFPGLGLLLGILGILAIGYLVSKERVKRVMALLEMPFTNLPVVKSIYSSLKSFADYFSPSSKATAQQVVILRIPGQQLELVGLVTRRNLEGLPEGFTQGDRVAVYLPMGYMIGGLYRVRAAGMGAADPDVGRGSHALVADCLDGARRNPQRPPRGAGRRAAHAPRTAGPARWRQRSRRPGLNHPIPIQRPSAPCPSSNSRLPKAAPLLKSTSCSRPPASATAAAPARCWWPKAT